MSTIKDHKAFYKLVEKGQYEEALAMLELFTFESFEQLFFKVVKPPRTGMRIPFGQREAFVRYFFKDHLQRSKYFENVCESPIRREWFAELFKREDLVCDDLFKRMGTEAPLCLMEAVKRNRVPFLRKEQLQSIIRNCHATELKEFLKTCVLLRVAEQLYYKQATEAVKKIVQKPLEELLVLVALWKYYFAWDLAVNKKEKDLRRNSEALSVHAMNLFISHVLHIKQLQGCLVEDRNFDVPEFQNKILLETEDKPPHYEVFEAWMAWHHHISSFVDEFCFSDRTTIYFDDKNVLIKKMDQEELSKFAYNDQKLLSFFSHEAGDFEKPGEDLDLSVEERQLLDLMGPGFNRDMRILQGDFIKNLYYKKTEIPSGLAQSLASAFTITDKLYFGKESETGFANELHWKTILLKMQQHQFSENFRALPFCEFTFDIEKYNNPKFIELTKELVDLLGSVFEMFTTDILAFQPKKNFNRFKPYLNLFDSIFLRIGKRVYTYPKINSVLHLSTFISNLALKIHKDEGKQKKVNEEMEESIAEAAISKGLEGTSGFKYTFNNAAGEKISGEIDAVLYDGHRVLGIEFKHSPLRANLDEISREREIVLAGASKQLERFERYLETGDKLINGELGIPETVAMEKKPVFGLIITTNFEFDHDIIDNKYYKISWKEWFWLLENMEEPLSVEGILKMISNNVYWEDVLDGTRFPY